MLIYDNKILSTFILTYLCYNKKIMYLYLDESGIDGKSKFVVVGGVYSDCNIFKNLIKKSIKKYIRNPKIKDEFKYADKNVSDSVRNKILKDISKTYSTISKKELFGKASIKNTLIELISENVLEIIKRETIKCVYIFYDKTRLSISKEDIIKSLSVKDIKIDFTMIDSKDSPGIQMADWIVGNERRVLDK